MGTNDLGTRRRLLATVAMLLAAVAIATIVYSYATAESVSVRTLDNAKAQKLYDEILEHRSEVCPGASPGSFEYKRNSCGGSPPTFSDMFSPGTVQYSIASRIVGEEKRLDWGALARRLAVAMAVALVAVGAILIWTRPVGIDTAGVGQANATELASATSDPTETLRRLKQLHQEGLITEAEYDVQRKRALDQI